MFSKKASFYGCTRAWDHYFGKSKEAGNMFFWKSLHICLKSWKILKYSVKNIHHPAYLKTLDLKRCHTDSEMQWHLDSRRQDCNAPSAQGQLFTMLLIAALQSCWHTIYIWQWEREDLVHGMSVVSTASSDINDKCLKLHDF